MEGVSHGASTEPMEATLVPLQFFRDAVKELESMREQELDRNRCFPVELVILLGRLLRRAASIGGGWCLVC